MKKNIGNAAPASANRKRKSSASSSHNTVLENEETEIVSLVNSSDSEG